MKIKYLSLLWALPFIVCANDAQLSLVSSSLVPLKSFQAELEEYIDRTISPETPGLAITVVVAGKPVLTKAYGVTKAGSSTTINTDTVFRLASLSKTFTSAAVGALVQNGELRWSSKVKAYLENLNFNNPEYAEELTLQHLLSHSTGLMPHAYTNLIEENLSYQRILQKMQQVPFVCAPGSCYSYQNVAFSLTGDIVARAANKSFEKTVQEELLTPLQMTNTSYGMQSFNNNKNHATPHVWNRRQKKWRPVSVKKNYYKVAPAAGVNASINDMRIWLMAQLGHYQHVLDNQTLGEMHSKHIKTTARQSHYYSGDWKDLEGAYYGLGWRVFDFDGQTNFVHHGGWVRGNRAEMVFNPTLQMGMVFLTNSETSYASEVVPRFLRLYAQYFLSK